MIIIIVVIWLIGSIVAIYIADHEYDSDKLFYVIIITSIIALIFNGSQIYNPELTHSIAIIEINPTWSSALILSIAEGICITGPIAAIYDIYQYIKYEKEYKSRRGK